MITCKILIKEMDGKVAIAMSPTNTDPTKMELKVASLLDAALRDVGEKLLQGTAAMAEGTGVAEMVRDFIAKHEKPE